MKPAQWWVIVVPTPNAPTETTRDSGLIVREMQRTEEVKRGVVTDVGTGVKAELGVPENATLLYRKGVPVDDVEFVLCSYDNVLGWEE